MTAGRAVRCPTSTDGVGLGFLAGAAGLVFIAVSDFGAAVTGLSAGDELIEVSSHAPAALPAAVGLSAFAAMLVRRKGTPRSDTRLMAAALACIPLMLLLPIPYLLTWRAILTDHGYTPCETTIAGRRTVYRWGPAASGSCR
ncbi:hypothetical protein [Methylorubrum extorquens]|uniref:hypothetical protein n=1 Tax=Methylorubrum extorquens TaxID=408 RepID=UPI002238A9B2|nr:hypothetical protein [Methylorubrum extorquens]UYW29377.1 hypothetical protein OKC48_13005 [Methylorubrum extorquens]UYW30921.1 hypothetical protein OKB92_18195 [Methylorubrum extorquens]